MFTRKNNLTDVIKQHRSLPVIWPLTTFRTCRKCLWYVSYVLMIGELIVGTASIVGKDRFLAALHLSQGAFRGIIGITFACLGVGFLFAMCEQICLWLLDRQWNSVKEQCDTNTLLNIVWHYPSGKAGRMLVSLLIAPLSTPPGLVFDRTVLQWLHLLLKNSSGDKIGLRRAIVVSLAEHGNEQSLEYMQDLNNCKYGGTKGDALHITLTECLPVLRTRLAYIAENGPLLRPSELPEEQGTLLVRPVQEVPTVDSNELLRIEHSSR